jgi:hypothetical protein
MTWKSARISPLGWLDFTLNRPIDGEESEKSLFTPRSITPGDADMIISTFSHPTNSPSLLASGGEN